MKKEVIQFSFPLQPHRLEHLRAMVKRFKNIRMHTMLVTLGLRGNTFDSGNGICSWVRAVKDTVSVVCRNINMLTKN